MQTDGRSELAKDHSQKQAAIRERLPQVLRDLLSQRGFQDDEQILKWITPSLRDLRDPNSIIDMKMAVDRLVLAHQRDETICIYADYDLDGTSALAMLLSAFQSLGLKKLIAYQPSRLNEGYGLHEAAIRKLVSEGVQLIVTVDLGVTACHEARVCRELGIDLIITDHHLPKEELPSALAVVNPNRTECRSELGHLCGTGVAFYLALSLKRALQEAGVDVTFDSKSLLDCFVIGTLTDMVPLVQENRVLVKHGLLALENTVRPGLRSLLKALGLNGQKLTANDVAIRFAPKLNALSRLESGVRPIDLYLADSAQAELLVSQVLGNNAERVTLQKQAEEQAMQMLFEAGERSAYFFYSRDFHKGVVGLVATKIAQQTGRPAFVGALSPEGSIVGSARAADQNKMGVLQALEASKENLAGFGGHAAAAGFQLSEEKAEAFRMALESFYAKVDYSEVNSELDFEVLARVQDFDTNFMNWLEQIGPFGVKFPAPKFGLKDAEITKVSSLKGQHLRVTLKQDGKPITALWFSPPKGAMESLGRGAKADFVVEPQWNYYNGTSSIQLLIQNMRL